MADNIPLNAGSGGSVVRTDDDGTAHWQYVKLAFGADNTQTIVGSISSNPLPVALSDTDNAVLDNIQTSVQLLDNAIYVDDADWTDSTSSHMLVGGLYQSTKQTITDGDVGPLQVTSNGVLHVNVDSYTDSQVDDAAFTPATDSVAMIGAFCDETATDSVDEGDGGALRMTARRALYTTFETPAGDSPWDDTNDALQVNVVAGSSSGTEYSEDVATPATIQGPTLMMERDDALATLTPIEADWAAARCSSTGALWTAVDGTVTVDLGANNDIQGDIANDAADSGNPVKIGAHATASVEGETEVAASDRVDLKADLSGVLLTRNAVCQQELVNFHGTQTDGAEDAVTGLGAGGAGIHNYITSVIIHNSNASTSGFAQLLDGSAGSAFATFPAPATGGTAINFDPPLKQPTANTALYVDTSAAISTIYITINGYQGQG